MIQDVGSSQARIIDDSEKVVAVEDDPEVEREKQEWAGVESLLDDGNDGEEVKVDN